MIVCHVAFTLETLNKGKLDSHGGTWKQRPATTTKKQGPERALAAAVLGKEITHIGPPQSLNKHEIPFVIQSLCTLQITKYIKCTKDQRGECVRLLASLLRTLTCWWHVIKQVVISSFVERQVMTSKVWQKIICLKSSPTQHCHSNIAVRGSSLRWGHHGRWFAAGLPWPC